MLSMAFCLTSCGDDDDPLEDVGIENGQGGGSSTRGIPTGYYSCGFLEATVTREINDATAAGDRNRLNNLGRDWGSYIVLAYHVVDNNTIDFVEEHVAFSHPWSVTHYYNKTVASKSICIYFTGNNGEGEYCERLNYTLNGDKIIINHSGAWGAQNLRYLNGTIVNEAASANTVYKKVLE